MRVRRNEAVPQIPVSLNNLFNSFLLRSSCIEKIRYFSFEQLLLENQRRGESLPPPPLPQHSSRIESRMQVGSREQSLFASSDAKAARPSARPRQRSQLAPKVNNFCINLIVQC